MAFFTIVAANAARHARAQQAAAVRPQLDTPHPWLELQLQPASGPLKVSVLTASSVEVDGTGFTIQGVCDRLTLCREATPEQPALFSSSSPALPPELEVGDPDFDRVFFVLGAPALVHAILDADTRRLLLKLADERNELVVENGTLRLVVPLSHGRHPLGVEALGRQAVELGQRLLTPDDVPRWLADNMRRDPVDGVRLRNLNALILEEPNHPATEAALRAAAIDRSLDLRLCAGLALGPAGREALLSVAESNAAEDALVAGAIDGLGHEVSDALASRFLLRAVGAVAGGPPVQPLAARAAMAALARGGGANAASALKAVLLVNASLAGDAARALGRMGGAESEGALIAALSGAPQEGRLAAARVLGECGGAAAVMPLREAAEEGGSWRRAAQAAIEQIQSRLKGTPGEVSLTGGGAGDVSLAEEASGRVSLPADPPKDRT